MISAVKLQYLDEERNIFIGKHIAEARKAKKYKACELADAIGIGKDQYSKIENGRVTCTIDNLFLLAQYLDLAVQFLLFGNCEKSEAKEAAKHSLESLDEEQLKRVPMLINAAFGMM